MTLISANYHRKMQSRPDKRSREYQELGRLFRQNINQVISRATSCNSGLNYLAAPLAKQRSKQPAVPAPVATSQANGTTIGPPKVTQSVASWRMLSRA